MNHSVAGVWHPLADSAWQPSGNLKLRYMLNRRYMISLETDRLLLNHEVLAGIVHRMDADARDYGGWESANCQLRGHFAGHYLSACAMAFAYHGDAVLRARGEEMVERLYLCQQEHGDGWCFSIRKPICTGWNARSRYGRRSTRYTNHHGSFGYGGACRFAARLGDP